MQGRTNPVCLNSRRTKSTQMWVSGRVSTYGDFVRLENRQNALAKPIINSFSTATDILRGAIFLTKLAHFLKYRGAIGNNTDIIIRLS